MKKESTCRGGGMADALDSGSSESNLVWVRLPSAAYRNVAFGFLPINSIVRKKAISYGIVFFVKPKIRYMFT
jgi:hypothetical protein